MTENILPAFNGQLNLRVAYTYDKAQVYGFLQHVVANAATYGIPGHILPEVQAIYNEIDWLSSPTGQDYQSANLAPDQHIRRMLNPTWPPTSHPVTISKFKVNGHIHHGLKYWGIYDLLGLFLSSIGHAPMGATKRNFYLPLTAVYGRWCKAIGSGPPPYMYQCTWVRQGNGAARFFLGASLAGYNAHPSLTGTWLYVMRRERYSLLRDEPFKLTNYDFLHCPVRYLRRGRGQRFGACAETYPFLELVKGHDPNTETCYGLALQAKGLISPTYQDNLSGSVWQNIRNPCLNCQFLIQLYNGNVQNFVAAMGNHGAPP